jgi:AcrR family transcriptional regulator
MVVKQSSYRQLQARATRERIANAARGLFRERGYVATTIEAIAEAAGVAVATVYSALGSKKAVLEEIRRLWIEESDVRSLLEEALALPDLGRRLELAARWHRQQLQHGHDVIQIYQQAAHVDPDIAELWVAILKGRASEKQRFVEALADGLKPGLNVKTATDIYVALEGLEIYEELVLRRGWSPKQYEWWLAETLKQQLLANLDVTA